MSSRPLHPNPNICARLIPRIDSNETLIEGYSERPAIDIPAAGSGDGDDECVILGRGRQTGIAERSVGRRVVHITQAIGVGGFPEPALQVTALNYDQSKNMHINGEPLLLPPGGRTTMYEGDMISLHNSQYEYRVVMLSNSNNNNVLSSTSSSTSSSPSLQFVSTTNNPWRVVREAGAVSPTQIAVPPPPPAASFRAVSLPTPRISQDDHALDLSDDDYDDDHFGIESRTIEIPERRPKRKRQYSSSEPATASATVALAAAAARQPSPINMSPLTDPGENENINNNNEKKSNGDEDDEDQKKPAAVTTTTATTAAASANAKTSSSDGGGGGVAAAAKNADVDLGGIIVSTKQKTKLSEEIQCCVCLDIQIQPRTLNPCGHTFCLGCVSKLDSCPECRERIDSHIPARMLDNLISTLVNIPCLLEDDDVEQYKIRKKAAEEEAKKESARISQRGKRRRPYRASRYMRTTSSSSRVALPPSFDGLMDDSFESLLPLAAAAGASAATATLDTWSSRRRHHHHHHRENTPAAVAAAAGRPHRNLSHAARALLQANPYARLSTRVARHSSATSSAVAAARHRQSTRAASRITTRFPPPPLSPAAAAAASTVFQPPPPPPPPVPTQLGTATASSSAAQASSSSALMTEGRTQADAICID